MVLSGLAGIAVQTQGTRFDLQAWNIVGDANWTVTDDVVQADKGSGFLVTPMAYGDFQMTVDIWVNDDANSGVFIRCSEPKMISATNAYEVNIFDKRPDPADRTGAIVNVAKPLTMVNAGGKWNTLEITAKGPKMTVVPNGVTTVRDAEDAKFARRPGCAAVRGWSGAVQKRSDSSPVTDIRCPRPHPRARLSRCRDHAADRGPVIDSRGLTPREAKLPPEAAVRGQLDLPGAARLRNADTAAWNSFGDVRFSK